MPARDNELRCVVAVLHGNKYSTAYRMSRMSETGGKVVPNNGGCNHACPCGRWINCPAYIDKTAQLARLRVKGNNSEIQEWYATNFHIDFVMPASFPNG